MKLRDLPRIIWCSPEIYRIIDAQMGVSSLYAGPILAGNYGIGEH